MKRHLGLFLVLFALVAALWTYVQSDGFALRIRPFVAKPLREIMGPGAEVGWVKANLLPPYVEVRDIVIPYGGRPDGMTVRKIKLNLNLLPLLWKRISIPSLTILEPRITARRSADGGIDIAGFLRAALENARRRSSDASSSFDVDIRNVTITKGSLSYIDDAGKADITIAGLEMRSRLRLQELSFDVRTLTGRVRIVTPAYPKVEGELNAACFWRRDTVVVRHAEILSPMARLAASGSVALGTDGPVDLKLTLKTGSSAGALNRFLKSRKADKQPIIEAAITVGGKLSSPQVDGSVKLGTLSSGDLTLQNAALHFHYRDGIADLFGENWKLGRKGGSATIDRMDARAAYEKGAVVIDHARIVAGDATLTAKGSLDPSLGYRMSVGGVSSGKGALLSVLTGIELGGELNLTGELAGPFSTPRFTGTLRGGPFSVRGIPFTAVTGAVDYADNRLFIEKAEIVQGLARYELSGSIDLSGPSPVFQATLDAEHSDVASIVELFYKRLPLDIRATGRLTFSGTSSAFSGTARLDVDAGSAYGESFDSGSLDVELSSGRVSFPNVALRKKGGTITGTGWIGFDGTYSAHVESAGVDLSAIDLRNGIPVAGPLALTISSSGSFSAPRVKARAESPALSYQGYVVGNTVCDLAIAEGQLGLAVTVQGRSGDSIDLHGTMKLKSPYAWSTSAKVRIAELEAATLGPVSEYLEKTRVTIDANLELSGVGGRSGSLNGILTSPRLSVTLGEYRVQNEGETRIRMAGGRAIIESFMMTGQGTRVSVAGSTGIGSGLDVKVTGDANLSLLRFATRAVEHGDGVATANVRITGAWNDPNITGEVDLNNGLVKIRDVPQRFSGLSGSVSFDRNRIATEGVRGEFGGGTIVVSGSAQMQNRKLVDFASKAVLENVTVRYPPGFTAAVGGTLYYDGDAVVQTLSGEVNILHARYERRVEWKSMLVDFSRGFTPKKKMDVGWIGDTILNVRFLGKENILLENNLAKIPLDLDMILRGTVNQPQVLGHLEASKGEVYFRKNVFRILNASADFADPNRINPALDVQAETRVREYQIRLSVTGYADRAVVNFVSDPPLTDANILALLTIGRKTEDIKGKEAEVGSGEAVAFATGKFQDILESRARSLTGLDRFQVDPYFSKADVAVPRVTAGKELVKDRLYVTYSSNVGATNPEQTFSIEYLMNKNVSLVGERNDIGDIGADIRFRFGFR